MQIRKKSSSERFPLVFFLAALLILGGCAFKTRHVDLKYPPEQSSEKGVAEAAIAQNPGTQILLLPFEDNRLRKGSIGEVLNGLGMKTAKVVAKNDVGEWVTVALETELKKSGYEVTRLKTPPERADSYFILSGEITRVFCTAYLSYEGEVTFHAKAEQEGRELLNKRYLGEGGAGLNWAMTSRSYGKTLSLALQSAIYEFIYDLRRITEKKYEAG